MRTNILTVIAVSVVKESGGDNLIIQVDSREKAGKKDHILDYFENQGIKTVRSKLFVGDYTLLHKQDVCIDIKQDVLELFNCLTKDHVRFRNELIRAQKNGILLIVLTEEKLPNGRIDCWKSPLWKSTTQKHKKGEPVTRVNPETMRKAMITMQEKYGVRFLFCDKQESGKRIVEILSGV